MGINIIDYGRLFWSIRGQTERTDFAKETGKIMDSFFQVDSAIDVNLSLELIALDLSLVFRLYDLAYSDNNIQNDVASYYDREPIMKSSFFSSRYSLSFNQNIVYLKEINRFLNENDYKKAYFDIFSVIMGHEEAGRAVRCENIIFIDSQILYVGDNYNSPKELVGSSEENCRPTVYYSGKKIFEPYRDYYRNLKSY